MPSQQQHQLQKDLLADLAIHAAVDHANRVYPVWGPLAMGYVIGFANRCKAAARPQFTCEECRRQATKDGFPEPPDARAWGAVLRAAVQVGAIRKAGMGRNQGRHQGYATLWEGV